MIKFFYRDLKWTEHMEYQQSFTDAECDNRKKKAKREEFFGNK